MSSGAESPTDKNCDVSKLCTLHAEVPSTALGAHLPMLSTGDPSDRCCSGCCSCAAGMFALAAAASASLMAHRRTARKYTKQVTVACAMTLQKWKQTGSRSSLPSLLSCSRCTFFHPMAAAAMQTSLLHASHTGQAWRLDFCASENMPIRKVLDLLASVGGWAQAHL